MQLFWLKIQVLCKLEQNRSCREHKRIRIVISNPFCGITGSLPPVPTQIFPLKTQNRFFKTTIFSFRKKKGLLPSNSIELFRKIKVRNVLCIGVQRCPIHIWRYLLCLVAITRLYTFLNSLQYKDDSNLHTYKQIEVNLLA